MHEAKRHKKQLFFSVPTPLPSVNYISVHTGKNSCLPNKRGGYKSVVASKTVFGTSVSIFGVFAKILGAFAKLRKVTISFVVSLRPSIHSSALPFIHLSVRLSLPPSFCPHGTTRLPLDGFPRNLVLECYRKTVEKIQVSINSNKNKGCFYVKTNIFPWPLPPGNNPIAVNKYYYYYLA